VPGKAFPSLPFPAPPFPEILGNFRKRERERGRWGEGGDREGESETLGKGGGELVPGHVYPHSTVQVDEQPSFECVLLSSHASLGQSSPSPQ